MIRTNPVPFQIWGKEEIEDGAIQQIQRAAELPIAVRGALMPDAHQGYGLPIGGVLATTETVIPYAVGVDIACRMKMTVFNAPPHMLEKKREKLRTALERNTVFGPGGQWPEPFDHAVMDDPAWDEVKRLHELKDKAHRQLGTSGGGNHFVEFGELIVREQIKGDGSSDGEGSSTYGSIPPGNYLAVLSHSGSRGLGARIADHYTKIAMDKHDTLPKAYKHLAWLHLEDEVGQEYWKAMNLAGSYASANHAIIHRMMIDSVRMEVLGGVENHHNFAWVEEIDGQQVIVHRKGATPAGEGVYGVIPGTMAAPGYVVRGKGNPDSLQSAAHGAGRRLSRSKAFKTLDWDQVEYKLKKEKVELLSAGLDEAPFAYKDIDVVMAAQADLVDSVAQFLPRLVKMAPAGNSKRGKKKYKRTR